MKKVNLILALCFIMMIMCSCNSKYSVDGFENLNVNDSNYELNHYILPSDDFADTYEYKNIDYTFRDEYLSIFYWTERSLIVIEYDEDVYTQAKEYCLDNMMLNESMTLEYNGYTFIENIKLAVGQERNSFPHWFNMFAYNDDVNILVFMGFYGTNYDYQKDLQNVKDNWGDFLDEHFAELHDFS